MKKAKKIISLLLSILMIITALPLTAVNSFAAEEITSGDYTYVVLDDGTAEITNYTGSATELSIPSEIDGYKVTHIGWDAFYQCAQLKSVTIPDSVTSIGIYAFACCTSLTSITIPDSVTSIGSAAFAYTSYYNNKSNWDKGILYIGNHLIDAKEDISGSVEIKRGTKTIADYAFYNCRSLTNITIPSSVTSIGEEALGYINFSSGTDEKIDLSIIGFAGSEAEKYASDNEFEFVHIELENLSINKVASKTTYFIGDTLDTTGLELTLTYKNGEIKTITSKFFITSEFDSSTVGTKTVTVSYSGKTDSFNVEVVKPSIVLSNATLSIDHIGGTETLTATTAPSKQNITWSSSNTSVATVSNGVVTAKGEGDAIITAKMVVNGIEYINTCKVSVVLLDSISVSKMPDKTVYYIGDTFNTSGLELLLSYRDGSTKTITTGYTISGFGSKTAGTNSVTVGYNGKIATFNVEVVKPSVTLSNNNLSFDSIGSTETLTVTTAPTDQSVTWISSNTSVATVSDDGVVTAKGDGNATITAKFTYNNIDYTATCDVTVKVPTVPTVTFPDVTNEAWYFNAVKFNVDNGYFHGYGNGTFGPADNIQRQDFVVVLSKIAGADLSAYAGQNGGFADVPTNDYYSAAVAWARDNKILSGYVDGRFGVGDPITREQACKIFYSYCKGSVSGDVNAVLAGYPDGGNVSDWARTAVAWAAQNNVVGGNGTLNPAGNANRAEMAQIIMNMSNNGIL